MFEKKEMLYEGKAKKVFSTTDPAVYLVEYKDDATAFNGLKKGSIASKGVMNNSITSILFTELEKKGIRTHFISRVDDRNQAVKPLQIIPLEVVVRNIAAGSLAKRLGLEEGTPLKETVVELYYKDDDLGDPMINHFHVSALDLASPEEVEYLYEQGLKINEILKGIFGEAGIDLVDFKLEFGRFGEEILLGDEISPDTCRLWDRMTHEKMDKDRFRRDLGKVEEAYIEVLKRLEERK